MLAIIHVAPSILFPFNISSPYWRNIYENMLKKHYKLAEKRQLDASWPLGPTDWVHAKLPLHKQMRSRHIALSGSFVQCACTEASPHGKNCKKSCTLPNIPMKTPAIQSGAPNAHLVIQAVFMGMFARAQDFLAILAMRRHLLTHTIARNSQTGQCIDTASDQSTFPTALGDESSRRHRQGSLHLAREHARNCIYTGN